MEEDSSMTTPKPAPDGYDGAIANTRNGLPLPLTILSGAAITTAPVAGS